LILLWAVAYTVVGYFQYQAILVFREPLEQLDQWVRQVPQDNLVQLVMQVVRESLAPQLHKEQLV
jgi:hypothetical protein